MSLPKSKPSKGWASLLQREMNESCRRPSGPGWKTFRELQVLLCLGQNRMHSLLASRVKTGEVEVFDGTVTNSGRIVRARWYREVLK